MKVEAFKLYLSVEVDEFEGAGDGRYKPQDSARSG
jgi:hypothetical protein